MLNEFFGQKSEFEKTIETVALLGIVVKIIKFSDFSKK